MSTQRLQLILLALVYLDLWIGHGRGRLILDATGIGDPIYDDLKLILPDIEPYRFTAPAKAALIQRLVVAIERQQIRIPSGWTVLLNELRRFEYEISPSGNISYNAPAGYHDDCVIALALANHGRWRAENTGSFQRIVLPDAAPVMEASLGGPRMARGLVRRGARVTL